IVLAEPNLTIPHSELSRRRFVLQPLADIRPDLVLPRFTRSLRQMLDDLRNNDTVSEYVSVF
ncbi:MAG: hypothetical protein WA376_12260, partial [Terrimicrobiaceae bacterium]